MKRIYLFSIIFTLLTTLAFAQDSSLAGQSIRVCGDGGEWPPYAYFARDTEGNKTTNIEGYTIDVLKAILEENQIGVEFELPAWGRCLAKADEGEEYQIALDASYSDERAQTYLLTDPYYVITPKVFFSKKAFPNGFPSVNTVDELFALGNICGLFSYNYEGFSEGIKNSNVETGAKDFSALAGKTLRGRCSGFLARYEILVGFSALGQDYLLEGQIADTNLPGAKPDDFYMLISRNYQHSEELKLVIDSGIQTLKESGRLDEILKKYVP